MLLHTCANILSPTCLSRFWVFLFSHKFYPIHAQIFYPPLAFPDFGVFLFSHRFYPIHVQIFYPPLAILDFGVFIFFKIFIPYIHAQNFLKILSYTCTNILSPTCLSRFWVSLFFSKFLSHTCANILSPTCANKGKF